jgi:hypothetical protein
MLVMGVKGIERCQWCGAVQVAVAERTVTAAKSARKNRTPGMHAGNLIPDLALKPSVN